ncbi:zinc-binding dehydrogenase [soil metagenome]
MKAAYYETTGTPDVIQYGDVRTPEPKAGEVRVKVTAASVNPVDCYIRAGLVAMPLPKPFVPGCDVAGVVDKVGDGVIRFKVGDRVWGSNQGLLGRQGSFAEYVVSSEDWLYPTPANVKDEDAAAAALVGITAWLGLVWRANVQAGELVVVSGGTGGVGAMVVQMAKANGATVYSIIGSKSGYALALGSDTLIDYRNDIKAQFTASLNAGRPGSKGADIWYETAPPTDLERTFECMAPGGRVVVMAGRGAKPVWPNGAFYTRNLQLFGFTMFSVSADIQRRAAEDINRWLSEGKLKATIGATFPLKDAAAAHRLQEDNTIHKKGTLTGKIVVTI